MDYGRHGEQAARHSLHERNASTGNNAARNTVMKTDPNRADLEDEVRIARAHNARQRRSGVYATLVDSTLSRRKDHCTRMRGKHTRHLPHMDF